MSSPASKITVGELLRSVFHDEGSIGILEGQQPRQALATTLATMIKTTILAYLIALLGLIMIGAGIWGFFYLQGQARSSPLRDYSLLFGMICGGFGMVGVAQALRILLDLVVAVQPIH